MCVCVCARALECLAQHPDGKEGWCFPTHLSCRTESAHDQDRYLQLEEELLWLVEGKDRLIQQQNLRPSVAVH